jgi:hypothetical protein
MRKGHPISTNCVSTQVLWVQMRAFLSHYEIKVALENGNYWMRFYSALP